MTHDYLNPLELLRLTRTRAELITPELLRSHKRRFLSELELDGKTSFTYHGREYTRNDLERAVAEAGMPEGLAAFLTAGKLKGFSAFLVTGEIPPAGAISFTDLAAPELSPLVKIYLPESYARTLRTSLRNGDWGTVEILLAWQPHSLGIPAGKLYAGLDDYLGPVVEKFGAVFGSFTYSLKQYGEEGMKVPHATAKKWVKKLRIFTALLPTQLTEHLPAYATGHLNQLVEELLPPLKYMCRGAETRMAHAIVQKLLALPHLTKDNRKALRALISEHPITLLDRLNPSDMDSPLAFVLRMMVFAATILSVALIWVNFNSEPVTAPTYSKEETQIMWEEKRKLIREKSEAYMQAKTSLFLRAKLLTGQTDFKVTAPKLEAILPTELMAPLGKPPVSVQSANQVLAYWGEDTLPHRGGMIQSPEEYIFSRPMKEIEAIRREVKPNGFIDTTYLDLRILELQKASAH